LWSVDCGLWIAGLRDCGFVFSPINLRQAADPSIRNYQSRNSIDKSPIANAIHNPQSTIHNLFAFYPLLVPTDQGARV
jgi:hypothetical protein